LAELFEYLDLQALIAGQWQFPKEQSKEEYEAFLAERCINSGAVEAAVIEEQLLQPRRFMAISLSGELLYLYAQEMNHKEALNTQEPVATFEFPQQRSRRHCT